jgi:transposase-like protein
MAATRPRNPRGGTARFRPPHCPNRSCRFHHVSTGWKYWRIGTRHRRGSRSPSPRFQCLACRRRFSDRTFATTYWLHRPALLAPIAALSIAGSGLRQIGRELGVSHSTVARHLARAGRHCLLAHRTMLEGGTIREEVAFDGFETFEYSQYFPCHFNLAAGRDSWFLYHFTDSPLRRKGSMTAEQKKERARLESRFGRPDPKAVENGILELLRALVPRMTAGRMPGARPEPETFRVAEPALLHSDDHPAYGRAVRRLRDEVGEVVILHQITPSTEPRTCANPLFPVNLADLLLRHCGANHRRETIAFSKRRQAAIERLAIFTVWRNAIKWRREKRPGRTAAMQAGILETPLTWGQLFGRRLFPHRRLLPGSWWDYYWRRIRTPALGETQVEHRLGYAF